MPNAKKTTAKKTTKNSSHKAKRAVLDVERWAAITHHGEVLVHNEGTTKATAIRVGKLYKDQRIVRVRVTEVTK
jgi:hypothetical protein